MKVFEKVKVECLSVRLDLDIQVDITKCLQVHLVWHPLNGQVPSHPLPRQAAHHLKKFDLH